LTAPAASPVPRQDLVVPRGASRTVRVTVALNGANLNLSLPGTQLIFTARLSNDDDAAPVVQKSYVAAGGTPHLNPDPGGIVVSEIDSDGDLVLDSWVADVEIDPADTEEVAASYLSYDVWLFDASGREVPVVEGRLRITPTTFRP
jgi:hypothetical protein